MWQKRWSKRYGKWVAQFSWTLDGKSDRPIEDKAYEEAERVASALLAGGIDDFTNGADHYHATYGHQFGQLGPMMSWWGDAANHLLLPMHHHK